MEAALFNKFSSIAYDKAGIYLAKGKEALVSARVAKRLRLLGLGNPREYLDYLEKDKSNEELIHFLDAISTNYTFFFREKDHLVFMAEILEKWRSHGQDRFRLWSAASSSGEEPYSIIIYAMEAFKGQKVDFKLLATDISTRILETAKRGNYSEQSIKPVSKPLKLRYFDRVGQRGAEDTSYSVKSQYKELVIFKRLNLSVVPFPMNGPLDIVFCRNVMIYFDHTVRQKLISEIERLLKPGGYLLVGHTETLTGIDTSLETVSPSIYRKKG